jgi:hypothetical protein
MSLRTFRYCTSVAAVLALLIARPAAAADAPARLFLYSSIWQSGATELLNSGATVTAQRTYGSGAFGSWTHVVGCGSQIFFYNIYTGAAALGAVDATGAFTTTFYHAGPYFAAGWDTVTYHNGRLFFYDKETGQLIVGQLMTNGTFSTALGWQGYIGTGWTHIVDAGNSVLFYNKSTGAGMVADVIILTAPGGGPFGTPAGTVLDSWTFPAFSSGWTHITNTGNGLLFYNATTGVAVMGDIDAAHNATTRSGSWQTIAPGYTSVVGGSQGVLFYNRTSGNAVVGTAGQSPITALGPLSMRAVPPGSFLGSATDIVPYVVVSPLH